MAGNLKRVFTTWEIGATLYAIIVKEADDTFLDNNDGSFRASPTTQANPLTADSTQPTMYVFDELRESWPFGNYIVNIYLQSGGSPIIANDTVISSGVLRILDNQNFTLRKTLDSGEYIGQYPPTATWNTTTKTVTGLDNIVQGLIIDQTLALTTDDSSVNIVRADTPTLTITLAQNITGDTVTFFVKTNINDSDGSALVNRAMTVSDAANGVVTITLTAVETASVGNKYAEVNLTNGGVVLTAAQFRLNIIERVKD